MKEVHELFFTNLCKVDDEGTFGVLIFVIMLKEGQGIVFAERVFAVFRANAAAERAGSMERYMRNQFRFFGISSPGRRELLKSLLTDWRTMAMSAAWSAVEWLWSREERECQYVAMELIQCRLAEYQKEDIARIRELIIRKSWWDTVDFIAANIAGPYFLRFEGEMESVSGKWNKSDDLWLRRSSIIFQLKYREKTSEHLLFGYCAYCAGERDFFIRKAIGWALRQYAKTEPDRVRRFLRSHELSALSVKEAEKSLR